MGPRARRRASRDPFPSAPRLERVISGFQAGADRGGIRAARAFGLETGGAMPKGFLTEEGPRPDFAELYGAVELPTASDPDPTERNVRDSDATVWFGAPETAGGKATLAACRIQGKSCVQVVGGVTRASDVAWWIRERNVRVLHVAGTRESEAPGIGDRVEEFLGAVFRQLGLRGG